MVNLALDGCDSHAWITASNAAIAKDYAKEPRVDGQPLVGVEVATGSIQLVDVLKVVRLVHVLSNRNVYNFTLSCVRALAGSLQC